MNAAVEREARMSTSAKIFRARQAMGRIVRGQALVRPMTASRRATISTASRACSRARRTSSSASPMSGRSWCSTPPRAGVATAWMLHEMQARGIVPLALVLNSVNPILAQGAALGDVPMLAGFDEDITAAAFAHGAEVEVDPQAKCRFRSWSENLA